MVYVYVCDAAKATVIKCCKNIFQRKYRLHLDIDGVIFVFKINGLNSRNLPEIGSTLYLVDTDYRDYPTWAISNYRHQPYPRLYLNFSKFGITKSNDIYGLFINELDIISNNMSFSDFELISPPWIHDWFMIINKEDRTLLYIQYGDSIFPPAIFRPL